MNLYVLYTLTVTKMIVIAFIISCLLSFYSVYHVHTASARISSTIKLSSVSHLHVNVRLGYNVNRERLNLSLLSMKDDGPHLPIDNKNKATGYSMYQCISCSYVYDEETGFKKRYPPGKLLMYLCLAISGY